MSTSCEVKTYQGITPYKVGVIRQRLIGEGATITGDNPWDADMHNAGVVLHGAWAAATNTLVVTITDKSWYASCNAVWSAVDKQITDVQALPEPAAPVGPAPPPAVVPSAPPIEPAVNTTPGGGYPAAIPWEPPPYVAPPPDEPAPASGMTLRQKLLLLAAVLAAAGALYAWRSGK
jgi:hypothetical protein